MNIIKKIGCRAYQTIFKMLSPFMPYREPKILNSLAEISETLKRYNKQKVLLVTDEGIYSLGLTKPLEEELKKANIDCFVFNKTVPNPTIAIVEDALKMYKTNGCEAIIAFGGGSPMDCAKMVGARASNPKKSIKKMKGICKVGKKLPLLIAVPTTAGTGSETTIAAVITDSETKHKYAINDFKLIPMYAVLDETLTLNLPQKITSTTGMDALTHAVEAYIGNSTTRRTRKCALEACKLVFENLYLAYMDGKNKIARKNMLKAAYLAGIAFTRSYVGYVHAVAHSLGGQYGVPHGLANAVILPYVLKEFGGSASKKLKQIAVYCGIVDDDEDDEKAAQIFISKIKELNAKMGIPNHIEQIKKEDIAHLATNANAEANPLYPVPKLLDTKELMLIYEKLMKK